jgi:hypothetical protein
MIIKHVPSCTCQYCLGASSSLILAHMSQ